MSAETYRFVADDRTAATGTRDYYLHTLRQPRFLLAQLLPVLVVVLIGSVVQEVVLAAVIGVAFLVFELVARYLRIRGQMRRQLAPGTELVAEYPDGEAFTVLNPRGLSRIRYADVGSVEDCGSLVQLRMRGTRIAYLLPAPLVPQQLRDRLRP